MDSRIEKAVEMFRGGYNCAQSVFATYADLFGVSDREIALKMASPFGGGLAGMHHVCGTVSGMSMIAGLYNGTVKPGDKVAKKINFDTVKVLTGEFEKRHGSIRCSQLLKLEPGMPDGMVRKPCVEYVRTCSSLIEQYLLEDRG